MLNQTILVGKVDAVGVRELMLIVERNYKNKEGLYDKDFVRIFFPELMEESLRLIDKDMTVAVKARLEQDHYNSPLKVMAEKVSFL